MKARSSRRGARRRWRRTSSCGASSTARDGDASPNLPPTPPSRAAGMDGVNMELTLPPGEAEIRRMNAALAEAGCRGARPKPKLAAAMEDWLERQTSCRRKGAEAHIGKAPTCGRRCEGPPWGQRRTSSCGCALTSTRTGGRPLTKPNLEQWRVRGVAPLMPGGELQREMRRIERRAL